MNPKEVTIETYNKTADKYAANVDGMYLKEKAEKFFTFIPKGASILDLGCGHGRDAKIFTEKGYKVVGVDLSDVLLEKAKKNAPKADFRLMDIVNMELPENSFDGVWAIASLLHIEKKDIPGVAKKVYDILKPDGVWYISVKEGEGEVLKPDKRYNGAEKFWSFFKKDELESLLRSSNFTILESNVSSSDSSYATNPWIDILCRK